MTEPLELPGRLDLPDGWADIRDPKKVPYGKRKPVTRAGTNLFRYHAALEEWDAALKAQQAHEAHPEIHGAVPIEKPAEDETPEGYVPTDEEMDLLEGLQETTTIAMVEAWSWDFPVSVEGLQNLPSDAVKMLVDNCSKYSTDLFINTEPSPDEASPTQP